MIKKISILCVWLIALAGVAQAGTGVCTCEDRDNQGQFGLWLYKYTAKKRVIKPNIGTWPQCRSAMNNTSQCNAPNKLCACYDWDNQGQFGVTLYTAGIKKTGRLLRGNIGTYQQCMAVRSSKQQCD
ncbi:MAG: hypothetical protein D3910_05420 [Candidatus Electrothrix sp. ATG2]|nr:hypothetical protein [Candidatus Electrothrix sp. ATG2]